MVRQRPGSAKGVIFITIEDETGIANLVVWTKIFESNRQTVLGASMLGLRGQVQKEGEAIHVIAHRLENMSVMLATIGDRDVDSSVYRPAPADGAKNGGGPDARDPNSKRLGRKAREIYIPDLRLGFGIVPGQPTEGIKVKPRDFR